MDEDTSVLFLRTTDHDTICEWVEDHGGVPVIATGEDATELIDIRFTNDQTAREISWEEFFDRFDANQLVFQYMRDVSPDEAIKTYSFVPAEIVQKNMEDETEFPELSDLATENIQNEFSGEDDPFQKNNDPEDEEL